MAHATRWEDSGTAELYSCNGVSLVKYEIILNNERVNGRTDDPVECPNCHKKLRLVWDVRIEEAE